MKIRILIVCAALAVMSGLVVAQTTTSVPTNVSVNLRTISVNTEKVLCLQDTNRDTIITISDNAEFFATTPAECMRTGGAPGNPAIVQIVQFRFLDIFKNIRQSIAAAVNYLTSPQKNTESTKTDTFGGSSASGMSSQTTGNFIGEIKGRIGILDSSALAKVARDRTRSGVDRKKWEKDKYMCGEFARDLEKSDPGYYTFFYMRCEYKLKCTRLSDGRKEKIRVAYGHFANDTHEPGGKIGFVEPQSGNEIDMDANGDGKIDNKDKDLVGSNGAIQSQLVSDLEKLSGLCSKVEVDEPMKCTVRSFESATDAYNTIPEVFPSNFNPNG